MSQYRFSLLPPLAIFLLLLPEAVFAAPCGDCHQEWLSKAKILAVRHSPFEDGDCESCHKQHGETNKLVLNAPGAKLCLDCHDDPAAGGKKVHTVVADNGCIDCHNPHSSPNKKLLTRPATKLCFDCHDDPAAGGKKKVHTVVADSGCLDCHNPHSSADKNLLTKPAAKLCFDCHDDPAAGGKKKVHTVVADSGCLDCHNPHSSANPNLTVKPGAKLCAECHDVPGPDQPVKHTALDDGCSGCHDPHSSVNPNLLLKTYRNEKTVKVYVAKDYDLCFDCHDQTLVTAEGGEISSATGFRNGETNLHNVHVIGSMEKNKYGMIKRGKPHACGICHSPHATDQDFVLIRQYDCGEVFCFTLNYTRENDGGFCRVGCHKPLAYSRTGQARTVEGVVVPPQEAKKPK